MHSKHTLHKHNILSPLLIIVATVIETMATHALRQNPEFGRFSDSQITAVHTKHKAHTQHATTACQVPTMVLPLPRLSQLLIVPVHHVRKMLLEAPMQSGTYSLAALSPDI